MGKLMDNLNRQLKTEFKTDAEDCIKIYNKLSEISGGKVWESDWGVLTTVRFKGFPKSERVYIPSTIGKIFINGLNYHNHGNY